MPKTYDAIASTTLTNNQSSVSFTNISANYTDLVLVCVGRFTSGADDLATTFNNDTTNNYSRTFALALGGSVLSGRTANTSSFLGPYWGSAQPCFTMMQIMNYSNTTTHKTILDRNGFATDPSAGIKVGLWANTAAISTITISRRGSIDIAADSVFTLYGIKAA